MPRLYTQGTAFPQTTSATWVAYCNGVFPNAGVCVIYQPTSSIFNSSVFLLGVLLVISAYLLWRPRKMKVFSILILLTGIGAMGVGVFPETNPVAHEITSDVAFLFAGLSAIWGYRLTRSPISYFSVILGVINLVAIVLFTANVLFGLGVGGMERMVVPRDRVGCGNRRLPYELRN